MFLNQNEPPSDHILIFIPIFAFGTVDYGYQQKLISKKTLKIIECFNNAKQVEGERMYSSAVPSQIYPKFIALSKDATTAELIELCKHPIAENVSPYKDRYK